MSVVLIEMVLLLLLSAAAYRWGADSRDGRDWHEVGGPFQVDRASARQAGCPAGAPAHR